jgi:GNAT superfamily N-acetyltransferase
VTEFRCELLTSEHDLSKFDCGVEPMNTWLWNSAMRGQVQGTGRTFVWCPDSPWPGVEPDEVVAYFTLAAHMIHQDDLAGAIARGRLRSLPSQIPAIMLARLALDRRLQGRGYGGALLASALERCVHAGRIAAAVYVVVDAIDDSALRFYQKRYFMPVPGTHRLVRPMRSIADEMEIPEPEDL